MIHRGEDPDPEPEISSQHSTSNLRSSDGSVQEKCIRYPYISGLQNENESMQAINSPSCSNYIAWPYYSQKDMVYDGGRNVFNSYDNTQFQANDPMLVKELRRKLYRLPQSSARSEARKEEARRQELEASRQRDDDLVSELMLLKQRFDELEQYARGCGITGIFILKNYVGAEEKKANSASTHIINFFYMRRNSRYVVKDNDNGIG